MAQSRDAIVLIAKSDPLAQAAIAAIHAGDVPALKQLLRGHTDLATARIAPDPGSCHRDQQMSRTLLHVTRSAAHGGQRAASEFLINRGPDLNWIGFDQLTALDAAQRSGATTLAAWLRENGGKSATAMAPLA
jgi:hypothetical protein